MTIELATIEQSALTPAEFAQELDDARIKAKALTEIVEEQKLFTMISGKKHLRVEAWQTIGMGYGLSAAVKGTDVLYNPLGVETGAKAGVVIYNKHGIVVGGAEAYCMCNEGDWGNRNTNQRVSMAGTRATSKALRLLLSWVVVLAGYEPTPAEEMTGDIKRDIPDLGTCEQHGVAWFKSDNMKSKAHKLDDGSWCNAPREPRQTSSRPPESVQDAATDARDEDWERVVDAATEAGMTWGEFELEVLHCTKETFLKRGGSGPDMALKLLANYLAGQQEEESRD